MPRPTDKKTLLAQSTEYFEKLLGMIDSIPKDKREQNFGFDDRDKNIRDILTHLYEWHLMMLNWYKVGMSGKKPNIPAEGYTWQTLPDLNKVIWEKYQDMSFSDALKNLKKSHAKVQKLIESHTDEELFTKKRYSWTNTTSLGAYLISSTSSHYDWAMKKIKRYVKELK